MIIPPLDGAQTFVFMGDSITADVTAPGATGNGFRFPLNTQFETDRTALVYPPTLTMSYVGSVNTGSAPTNNNQGIGGSTAGSMLAFIPTYYGPGKTVVTADLVWLLIGINNCATAADYQAFFTDYPSLINTMSSLTGCKRFFVSTIRPVAGVRYNRAVSLNAELPGIWNALEAADPTLILVRGSENVNGFPLHPDETEYAALSVLWYPHMKKLLGY